MFNWSCPIGRSSREEMKGVDSDVSRYRHTVICCLSGFVDELITRRPRMIPRQINRQPLWWIESYVEGRRSVKPVIVSVPEGLTDAVWTIGCCAGQLITVLLWLGEVAEGGQFNWKPVGPCNLVGVHSNRSVVGIRFPNNSSDGVDIANCSSTINAYKACKMRAFQIP